MRRYGCRQCLPASVDRASLLASLARELRALWLVRFGLFVPASELCSILFVFGFVKHLCPTARGRATESNRPEGGC